ncbi:MAG: type IV secretion system protein [Candidatus Midichloria sp.]|nr:MAG: type IV secretion system protein [Candidatus Midichloria sp.]
MKPLLYNVIFYLLVLVALLAIVSFFFFVIRYVRSTRSIEPFIIEIERKTVVPTVVDLVTIEAYSANTSIKRYFVWR